MLKRHLLLRLLRKQKRKNNFAVKLIVGLGNPGSRYSDTRHNAGRLLVEFAANKLSASFKSYKKLKASTVPVSFGKEEIILSYPETYVNLSGEAISLLVQEFEVKISSELLIVVDDMALPFGRYRLRSRGSDGGHNGLKSIAASLNTAAFARLRIGIAPESHVGGDVLKDFVLESFSKQEKTVLPRVLGEGYEALKAWSMQPMERAMNVVNALK